MTKRRGMTNAAAKEDSRELLAHAVRAEAIAQHDLPTVRGILDRAGEISGRDLSPGWLYSCIGDAGLSGYLADQGIHSAVVVDGIVYTDIPGGPTEIIAQNDVDITGLSAEILRTMIARISAELDSRPNGN